MKRHLFASLLLALALLIWGCSSSSRPDAQLSESIAAAVSQGPRAIVDLRTLTDFKWDELHVFAPYTPLDRVEERLGLRWPEAKNSGIESLDSFNLLVFVEDGRVVRYVEHPRDKGDFSDLDRAEPWVPGDRFVVRETKLGWLMLEPEPSAP